MKTKQKIALTMAIGLLMTGFVSADHLDFEDDEEIDIHEPKNQSLIEWNEDSPLVVETDIDISSHGDEYEVTSLDVELVDYDQGYTGFFLHLLEDGEYQEKDYLDVYVNGEEVESAEDITEHQEFTATIEIHTEVLEDESVAYADATLENVHEITEEYMDNEYNRNPEDVFALSAYVDAEDDAGEDIGYSMTEHHVGILEHVSESASAFDIGFRELMFLVIILAIVGAIGNL